MTETAEPWAAYFEPGAGEINDPLAPFLPPDLVAFRRNEILARAEAKRQRDEETQRRAERQQARDDHLHLWTEARRFELAMRGRDANDPGNLALSDDERATRAFYRQDQENAELERRAKREAARILADAGISGPVTVNAAGPPPPHPSVEPSLGDPPPPASRSTSMAALRSGAAATPVASRIRAAYDRWATRSTGCACASCTGEDVHRGDPAAGLPEITRTFYAGDRVR
jgi:hypothetical protein